MVSQPPTCGLLLLVLLGMLTRLLGSASGCPSVCVSDELQAIRKSLEEVQNLKQTLKEIQHSIFSNQFFIKRNFQAGLSVPSEFFCPKEIPGSCYLFVQEKKTWLAAQQYCMGKRGHLVAIETWDENNFLKKQIEGLHTGAAAWWTGGSNDGVTGQWKWKMPKGKDVPLRYHDWDTNQPDHDGKGETVIELWQAHHRWNDRPDSLKNFFICEYDKPQGSGALAAKP